MGDISANMFNPGDTIQTIKDGVGDNSFTIFIVLLVITSIGIICIYVYKHITKEKKKVKTDPDADIYPGYTLPCPDYWTNISGNGEKHDGICYNPEKLGTCRIHTNIHYGDSIYIINVSNQYIDLHKDDIIKQPININTDLSYNPDISYMTLSHTFSSCNTDMNASKIDDMTCYEKKKIVNNIPYINKKDPNFYIKNVDDSLHRAKEICNGKSDIHVPIGWHVYINDIYKVDINRLTSDGKNKLALKKNEIETYTSRRPKNKRYICMYNKNKTTYCSLAKISKCYFTILLDNNNKKIGMEWQINPPTDDIIPESMKCQGIKKYNDIFKLIYGKVSIPEGSLTEGHSNDTVWVKSFCKNTTTNRNIFNTLIPTDKSIWSLEHVDDILKTEPLAYYQPNDKHIFYIKHIDVETRDVDYISICNNNIITDTTKNYISNPEGCKPSYMSIVSTNAPNSNMSHWILYRHVNNPVTEQSNHTVHTVEQFYLGSMYKYDVANNRPRYFLGTCGKKKNDKYLQLIEYDDLDTYDNAWSCIITAPSKLNPIIPEINLNDMLGIDIKKNEDISNNKYNLRKKCEWAKSCNTPWDVVDKLC